MARGSIRRRGATWTVVVDVGRDPVTARRKQTTKGGFSTKREAQAWLTDTAGKLGQGTYVAPTKETVGSYLTGWLAAIRSSKKQSTYESYERMIRQHLVPRLGTFYLHQLGPEHLSAAFADLAQNGRLDGQGGLSPRMVHYAHTILRKALADAQEEGKVSPNVAAMSTVRRRLPKQRRAEHRTWTAAELGRFLEYVADDPILPAVRLAATTGMRRGEVLGVRWSDVDLDRGRVSICQTVTAPRDVETGQNQPRIESIKTDRPRSVDIPPRTVAALKAQKKAQNEMRLLAGPGYVDRGLVFAMPDGSPLHPDGFAKRFRNRVRHAGLPPIRVHDLRHTWATLALQAGVHPKVVQETLGHSSIAITLNVYSHVAPGMGRAAAETVDGLIGGGGS